MNVKEWARGQGVWYAAVLRWFRSGKLPVPAYRAGRLIVIGSPVPAPATGQRLPVDRVVTEAGSAVDGRRRKFLALLRDESVTAVVVEHRGGFARFGAGYVEAALSAQGRRLLVVDPPGVDVDLVREVTGILTSLCARLYGQRGARSRAQRAVKVLAEDSS